MKDLKIGRLLIKKKALLIIALCLFINGMVIGAAVAFKQTTRQDLNVLVMYVAIFLPYILLFKSITSNIEESVRE